MSSETFPADARCPLRVREGFVYCTERTAELPTLPSLAEGENG